MRFYITAFCLLACPAIAQECVEISEDAARLACYDKAAGNVADEAPAVVADDSSRIDSSWMVDIEKSALKDTTDVYLSAFSSSLTTCRSFGNGSSAPTLTLRCLEDTTSVIITTNCHMVSNHGGYGRVDYRFDDETAKRVDMVESTNNRALGLWSGRSAIPFIKSMIGKERMLTRFTPFSESPQEFSFDITGLEEAIKPLRKECGW